MKKTALFVIAIVFAVLAGGANAMTVNADLGGYSAGTWTNSNVTATLTCTPDGTSTCTTYYCTGAACNPTTAGTSYIVSTEGETILRYKAVDSNGLTVNGSGDVSIKIDKTAPSGVSLTFPVAGTISGPVTLTGSANDTGSGISKYEFYYNGTGGTVGGGKINEGNPSYSWNTTGVTNGTYDIYAKAIDLAGNSANSSPVSFTIANATALAITENQSIPSNTNVSSYTYIFTANASGTYAISGNYCAPGNGSFLAGSNTITITLVDVATNGSKSCTITFTGSGSSVVKTNTFTYDTTAPSSVSLSNTPSNPSESTSISIAVGGTDVSYYKYYLDNGSFGTERAIAQSISEGSLSAGSHTLYVVGRDLVGNWQSSPTTFTWTINPGSAPTAELSGTPSDPSSDTSINITVGGTGVTHYKYKLDSGSYSAEIAVATKIALSGLAKGELHRIYVIGRNSSNMWQSTPTEYEWEISRTATTTNDVNASARYKFLTDLEQGDTHTDIIALHNILKKEGFYRGNITNYFSADTAKALKEYQVENRLTQSGMLDLKTRTYLNANAPVVTAQGGTVGAVVSTANKVKGYLFPTTIWFGKTGNDVKELQKRLIFEKFYTGAITGVLDAATKVAMKAYQVKNKLDDTGILDDITMRFMNAHVPYYDAGPFKFSAILKLKDKGEDVKQLQQILYKEKFYKYLPNSEFTASTQAALKLFQAKYKLVVSGIVDAATMAKLNTLLGVSTTVAPVATTPASTATVGTYKFTVAKAFGAKGDDITMLQKFLFKTGHYKWAANGSFTTGVESALSAFQKKYNLPTSGELDKATMDKINSLWDSIMGTVKGAATTAVAPAATSTTAPATSLPTDKAQLEAMYQAIKAMLGK